jgi:hypothetical protein
MDDSICPSPKSIAAHARGREEGTPQRTRSGGRPTPATQNVGRSVPRPSHGAVTAFSAPRFRGYAHKPQRVPLCRRTARAPLRGAADDARDLCVHKYALFHSSLSFLGVPWGTASPRASCKTSANGDRRRADTRHSSSRTVWRRRQGYRGKRLKLGECGDGE